MQDFLKVREDRKSLTDVPETSVCPRSHVREVQETCKIYLGESAPKDE